MLDKNYTKVAALATLSFITFAGCSPLVATLVANNADISDLSSLSDKEFCEISYNRWNSEGPETEVIYADYLRRFGVSGRSSQGACRQILNIYGENPSRISGAQTNAEPTESKQPVRTATPSVNVNNSGLTAIIANPQTSANAALAICRPQANDAKRQAINQVNQSSRPSSYDTTCRRDYFGNYDCNSQERRPSGGFMAGLARGVAEASSGRSAYNSVLASCLADYGWRN